MKQTACTTRVALVGAGFIARVHLLILARRRDVKVVAVCDPALDRAQALADEFGIDTVVGRIGDLAPEGVDAVHVLVPPEHHLAVASECLDAGYHVLVEKPLALCVEDATALAERARAAEVQLAVNHNMTWQPVIRRLRRDLVAGRIGRVEHVHIAHSVPLRQLDSGDVAHFMFQSEANILLEQGVHLFSMVVSICGGASRVRATTGEPRRLANGARFFDSWSIALDCQRATAHVDLGFGRGFNTTSVEVLGTDGAARLDLVRGTYQLLRKTRWLEFYDHALNTMRGGRRLFFQGIGLALNYGLSLFRLRGPTEPFLASMVSSIGDFHAAVCSGRAPECDARQATAVLAMCRDAAASAGVSFATVSGSSAASIDPRPVRPGEVVVTGGTGFLGRHLVACLLEAGRPVTLLVRRPSTLPEQLIDDRIRLVVGDAMDPAAIGRALVGAQFCVHMATCAGDDPSQVEHSMREGVQTVAAACVEQGIERFVFISSTAALYLGGSRPVRGADGVDPKPGARPAYARGKIAAEHALAEIVGLRGLQAVVLRPAIVVGAGGVTEHSGVGLWVRDNHCVGWGSGRVQLPFVLAGDVANAIAASLDAEGIDGKAYNLAGDVRITAREYVELLRVATGRDLHFHPQALVVMYAIEMGKLLIKVAAGRRAERQSMRDLRSRAFLAALDCSDAKADLGWRPETTLQHFLAASIELRGSDGRP